MRRLFVILIFLIICFPVKLVGDEPPDYPLRSAYPLPHPPNFEFCEENNPHDVGSFKIKYREVIIKKRSSIKVYNNGKEK